MQFLKYYSIKDSIRFINSNITYLQDTSNQTLFKYALFYNIDKFYKLMNPFKIDPYQISNKIKNQFPSFLKECISNAYYHADPKEQLFCYYLLIAYISEQFIKDYIEAFVSKKKNENYIEKMIETYLFNKNEKMKLHKTNIADYFFSSFELTPSDIALLEKPIKRQFGFFCTKNYFNSCYQSAKFYFDHLANSMTGIKKVFYTTYDLTLNHRKTKQKAKTFLYPHHLDTTILNLTKQEFTLKNKIVTYSFDELYQEILKECRRGCDILNCYFTGNQNLKPFNKYFNTNFKLETA